MASKFESNCIDGDSFMKLNDEDLKELVPLLGVRTKIREILKEES